MSQTATQVDFHLSNWIKSVHGLQFQDEHRVESELEDV